jgi:type IV secretory pathway VirB10-like protein
VNKKSSFLSPEETLRLWASLDAKPAQPEYVHRNICVPSVDVTPRPKCHALDNYVNMPKDMSPERLQAGLEILKELEPKPQTPKKEKLAKPTPKKQKIATPIKEKAQTWTERLEEMAQSTVKLDETLEAAHLLGTAKEYNKQFGSGYVSPAKENATNKAFFDAGQNFHTLHQRHKSTHDCISMSGKLFDAYKLWQDFCNVWGAEFSQKLGEEKT